METELRSAKCIILIRTFSCKKKDLYEGLSFVKTHLSVNLD